MAAKFGRLSQGFGKEKRNRVSSQDNMLEERNPSTAGINRFPSTDHFHFTGENNPGAAPRKRAWTESINMCDEGNKLTEDWMKDWQVGLKRSLRSINQASIL